MLEILRRQCEKFKAKGWTDSREFSLDVRFSFRSFLVPVSSFRSKGVRSTFKAGAKLYDNEGNRFSAELDARAKFLQKDLSSSVGLGSNGSPTFEQNCFVVERYRGERKKKKKKKQKRAGRVPLPRRSRAANHRG